MPCSFSTAKFLTFPCQTQDIPAILSHLNQVRECWRDNLRTAVVLIVPPFVIRYFIWRCPDFYDWRVGTSVLPEDEEIYRQQLDN